MSKFNVFNKLGSILSGAMTNGGDSAKAMDALTALSPESSKFAKVLSSRPTLERLVEKRYPNAKVVAHFGEFVGGKDNMIVGHGWTTVGGELNENDRIRGISAYAQVEEGKTFAWLKTIAQLEDAEGKLKADPESWYETLNPETGEVVPETRKFAGEDNIKWNVDARTEDAYEFAQDMYQWLAFGVIGEEAEDATMLKATRRDFVFIAQLGAEGGDEMSKGKKIGYKQPVVAMIVLQVPSVSKKPAATASSIPGVSAPMVRKAKAARTAVAPATSRGVRESFDQGADAAAPAPKPAANGNGIASGSDF